MQTTPRHMEKLMQLLMQLLMQQTQPIAKPGCGPLFYQTSSNSLIKRAGLVLLAAALALVPAIAPALPSDANQPIQIEGDDAKIDQINETIVYTGNVEVVQGTLRVWGDKMIVKISGDQVKQITTLGGPARYSQQLEGNQGKVNAHANSIVYYTAQERIFLNGDASLKQKGNALQSESIRYNIVSGKVDASAGEKPGRVRMQLAPQTRPPAEE